MAPISQTSIRHIARTGGAISAVLLAVSCWFMAAKVNNAVSGKIRPVFMPVKDQSFYFADRDVAFEFQPDPIVESEPSGPGSIIVTYGDQSLPLRVLIPPSEAMSQIPLMRAHADWMQVLRFTEGTAAELQRVNNEIAKGNLPDRLVIVTRIPPQGVDPRTWGQIWRKEWTFAFYEFLPEGGFRKEQLAFPTSKRYQPNKPGELVEGTWQFGAALMVMPKGTVPSPRFADDGLRAMGWTLPGATIGASGLTLSIIILAASRVRRRTPA
ncbi:MAG: hypothetical protein KF705_03485 [Phycisphaeraceae bacterium]|nr:hypothetical protein [Phycisphaeraceae bacterium]